MANFQRIGAKSNSHAGIEFGQLVQSFFYTQAALLEPEFAIEIGVGSKKKLHRFDFGSSNPDILIECKSHAWTASGNVPSAKMTVWNEAMYYFHLAPSRFRKIFVVLKHMKADISLATYYVKRYEHMIPHDVEVWEFDIESRKGYRIH